MLTPMSKRSLFPQQDLAERLRRALEESGRSQADLARACGVTDQAVHGWITNGRIAKQHLATICAMTGKTLDYFLIGLKTWRRAAAIAVLFIAPHAIFVAKGLVCVLCQIPRIYGWRWPELRFRFFPLSYTATT